MCLCLRWCCCCWCWIRMNETEKKEHCMDFSIRKFDSVELDSSMDRTNEIKCKQKEKHRIWLDRCHFLFWNQLNDWNAFSCIMHFDLSDIDISLTKNDAFCWQQVIWFCGHKSRFFYNVNQKKKNKQTQFLKLRKKQCWKR